MLKRAKAWEIVAGVIRSSRSTEHAPEWEAALDALVLNLCAAFAYADKQFDAELFQRRAGGA